MGYRTDEHVIIRTDNPELSAQLANTALDVIDLNNRSAHFERINIEKNGTVHAGGYGNTSFSSGACIQGKEVYVSRCGATHSASAASGWATIVAYTRNEDGSFSSQILPLDYTTGEYRDPNITTDPTGKYLILTATKFDEVNYTGYLWILDADLAIVGTPVIIDAASTTTFFWGNTLVTPTGKLLKCGYDVGTQGGIYLYRSTGDISNIGTFSRVSTIANPSANKFTECTIAYWGSKIIAIMRANSSNAFTSINPDLEGSAAWIGAVFNYTSIIAAPAMEAYNNGNEPLLAQITLTVSTVRKIVLIATLDGISWSQPVVVDTGQYGSFVKTRFGYGCMYYSDAGLDTNLWFRDLDISRFLGNLGFYKRNYKPLNNAKIRKNGAMTIPAATTTQVTFDTVVYDSNTIFDIANPTRLTVKSPGIYMINGNAGFSAGTGRIYLSLWVNGVPVQTQESVNTATGMLLSLSCLANITSVNTVIELSAYSTNATTLYVSGIQSPMLAISKISE